MGCGASAPGRAVADSAPEKASRTFAKQVASEDLKNSRADMQPGALNNALDALPDVADASIVAEPAARRELPPPMVPPADFSEFARSSGKLPKEAIKALLEAIGCRKGVLNLAMAVFDEVAMPVDEAGVDLAIWWGALNARSRIVIESKLRGCNSKVIFAVTHACGVVTVGEPTASASEADLQEALELFGVSAGRIGEMGLPGAAEAVRACRST